MSRQVAFSEHEAALLLDAYLKVLRGEKSRMASIQECSTQLRQMALNTGKHIDDIYRNVNGITFQMSSMESAYQGHTIMKPATRLFTQVVDLYRNSTKQYQKLLMEAKEMAKTKEDLEAMFVAWLSENVSGAQLSEIYMALCEIEVQAKKNKIIKQSLYEKIDPTSIKRIKTRIEGNRNFKNTHKRQWSRILSALNYLLKYSVQEHSVQKTVVAERTNSNSTSANKDFAFMSVKEDADSFEHRRDGSKAENSESTVIFTSEAIIDFENIREISFSKPVSLSYFGEIKQETSWKGLFIDVCKYLLDDYPHVFKRLKEESLNGTRKTWLVDEKHLGLLAVPKKIQDGYYVETNRNAYDLVKNLKWILNKCSVNYENVVIVYVGTKEEKKSAQATIPAVPQTKKKPTVKGDRESFLCWLRDDQHMAEATCRSYVSAISSAERFAKERSLDSVKLYTSDPQEARATADELFNHQGFLRYNDDQHNRFRAAITKLLAYYGSNLSQTKPRTTNIDYSERSAHALKCDPGGPKARNNQNIVDERWLSILKDYFPDGYILDDFLSQFQAGAFWQERYSESCPVEGEAIDEAMKAIGTTRDGRVFANKEEDRALISSICEDVDNILSRYSAVYRASIYCRYQDQLASCQIYTEEVMTQQVLKEANKRFYSYYQCFVKQGQEASVTNDARKVLRNHGGAMSVGDITNELWFIPYDIVYHCLTLDEKAISIGNSVWMLAENFPLTEEDAKLVGNMLDECFLSQNYVKAQELIPLLKHHLPSIADNLSGLHFTAVFNILSYHLKNRFSFSRAIISPKGAKTEFRDLFREFAKEHEQFTLEELSAFAGDLRVPIYWESTFNGGAVRISRTEFVNRSRISFNIAETDAVLERFCTGDYLPLQEVSSAMMMHLPSCGYRWNGYLLLSYLYGYSKTFRLFYNSLGKSGYYGALVRRSCEEIDCYEKLIERVLIQNRTWQTEDEALDVLIDNGLQAQRRLKGIEQIVAKVRNSRIHEEGD